MSENTIELLYGKPLQTLITEALILLSADGKEEVLIRDIIFKITERRPVLQQFVSNSKDKSKVRWRILNCVRNLNKVNLIKTEIRKTQPHGTNYTVVYTHIKN